MKRWLLSLLLLLGTLAPAPRAAAQGFIIPEIGARKNGMGTAIGRPDDLTAIYHNPAALALLSGTRVGFSFTAAFLYTDIRVHEWYVGQGAQRGPFLPDAADAEGYYERQTPGTFAPIPFIGASTNLFSDKLTVAIGVYVPNAAGADFGADKPSRYHVIDAYVISAYLTAAVAYRPFDWLAIGVGGSAVYIRVQRRSLFYPVLTLKGKQFDSSFLLGKETELNLEGEDIKPAFNLGIQVWPHKTVSLGFMMLTRYDVALEGPLTLTPGADASQLVKKTEFTDNQQVTEIVSPWIFGFGANWDIFPWLELGAELRIYLNSQVEEQVTRITNEGPLKDLIGPEGIVTPKNLENTFHVGAGIKIRPPLPNLELMTGFHYEPSPSPDNTVEVSAPSFNIFAVHFGARYTFAKRFALTLIYSHYEYLERATVDSLTSPPTNFVGSGYNNQISVVFEAQIAGGIGMGK
jgi:long-subunit fatty acid transport protein